MTKTVCDFCKKEMPTSPFLSSIRDFNFAISRHGICLDICDDCRTALNEWIKSRESEDNDADSD